MFELHSCFIRSFVSCSKLNWIDRTLADAATMSTFGNKFYLSQVVLGFKTCLVFSCNRALLDFHTAFFSLLNNYTFSYTQLLLLFYYKKL